MIQEIENFEESIKDYKTLFFDKIKEKHSGGWKIIYNIQGLNKDGIFYNNLKFIFWVNDEQTELTDNVITYLYTQYCNYKTISLTNKNMNEIISTILNFVKTERTNKLLSDLTVSGTDEFNKLIKKNNYSGFIQNLIYVPHLNKSCASTVFNFILTFNERKIDFSLKSYKEYFILSIEGLDFTVKTLEEIYTKIINKIYETK